MQILIINGPNLNKIGIREPEIYGNRSFNNYLDELSVLFKSHNLKYFQSHSENKIVEEILSQSEKIDGLVLNAGAYTHTSVAIRDAIASVKLPVVLVHISNVYAREQFRKHNILAPVCKGVITGFGLDSYKLAIYSLI
ncbi:MAG TPA: type II 3-dehydroquinate dehydratase [Bacteroidales bacterium]|nr:type II 3-dehydroquinate dehydratase [Bacteroidales bacterium]